MWGKDQAEHDMRLKQVMDMAKACGLKFNKGKCKFGQNQISYVGHVLSGEGLKADPEKIRAVQDMKRPQSQRETDDISRIHPISEEIHAQHGRHQCSSQKTDREGC